MRPQHSDSFIHSSQGLLGPHSECHTDLQILADFTNPDIVKLWLTNTVRFIQKPLWQHCYFNNYVDICSCFHCLRCKIPIHRSRQVLDFILSRGISVQKAFLAIPMAKRRVYFNGGLICRPWARQLPSTLRNFWYTTQNKRIAEAHQRCGDRFQVHGKQGSRSYFRWYLVVHQSWEKQRDKAPIN